jgi:Tol biopolymer transport system component
MGLTAGTKLGPYEIVSPLGAGGMGEVYRARDTKLNRDVALKVLPESLSHDAERLARFKREAQVLASLNHPNIATIHGLEESGGLQALVMELVEGQTLAEIVGARHGVPLQDALPIAKQITDALEYAHDHGIIHRDLKPANVKVTPDGTVKVLDFGLAKALDADPASSSSNVSNSPTLTIAATQAGVIIGTAAYMSPEQARGKTADRRADIWSFGCVVYEMLAGKRLFEGETVSDTLAAVLTKEPDWDALPVQTPWRIRELVRRCLVRDRRQRLQAIGEARIAIEETISGEEGARHGDSLPAGETPPLRRALPWALAFVGLALSAILVLVQPGFIFQPKGAKDVISFSVLPPENTAFQQLGGFVQVSPDGRKLAYVAIDKDAKPQIWVRTLSDLTPRVLPGTEGATWLFWSPDSRSLGFDADGKLKKVEASGGPVQTLADASAGSGTWNADGVIVYANEHVLYRVPESGGTPVKVVEPDASQHELDAFPQFLPDGKHFLFGAIRNDARSGLMVRISSLDSREVKNLVTVNSSVEYVPPGYLLYLQEGTLMARRFDAGSLEFTSEPISVAENVGSYSLFPFSYFSASASVLEYQTPSDQTTNEMTWFDRKGAKLGSVAEVGAFANPAISPDGTKLAVASFGSQSNSRDIWVFDLKRGTGSPVTFDPTSFLDPVWSRDGNQILFTAEHNGIIGMYQKAATGLGPAGLLFESSPGLIGLNDLSPDGRYAVLTELAHPLSLAVFSIPDKQKQNSFVSGNFSAANATFSPNGRYVAYASNETGQLEVFVQTFPEQTGKSQVSNSGGNEPQWRRDGNELFYLKPDGTVMSVDVKTVVGEFQAGRPHALFQAQLASGTGYVRNHYAVSPDGRRFLMLVPAGEAKPTPLTVVVNWQSLLEKK